MIPDLDIYRSAQALIKQHGQDAPIHAAMRADAMLEAGEPVVFAEQPLPHLVPARHALIISRGS